MSVPYNRLLRYYSLTFVVCQCCNFTAKMNEMATTKFSFWLKCLHWDRHEADLSADSTVQRRLNRDWQKAIFLLTGSALVEGFIIVMLLRGSEGPPRITGQSLVRLQTRLSLRASPSLLCNSFNLNQECDKPCASFSFLSDSENGQHESQTPHPSSYDILSTSGLPEAIIPPDPAFSPWTQS